MEEEIQIFNHYMPIMMIINFYLQLKKEVKLKKNQVLNLKKLIYLGKTNLVLNHFES